MKIIIFALLLFIANSLYSQNLILIPKWVKGDSKTLEIKNITPAEKENENQNETTLFLEYDTSITKVKWTVIENINNIAYFEWEIIDFEMDTTNLKGNRLDIARRLYAINKNVKYFYYTKQEGNFDYSKINNAIEEKIIKNACEILNVPYIDPYAIDEKEYITDFSCNEIRILTKKCFQEQIATLHSYYGDNLAVGQKRSLDDLNLAEQMKELGETVTIEGDYFVEIYDKDIKVTYEAKADMMGMVKTMIGAFQEGKENNSKIKKKSKKKSKKKNENNDYFDKKIEELGNMELVMYFHGYGIFDINSHIPNEMNHIISVNINTENEKIRSDTINIIRVLN